MTDVDEIRAYGQNHCLHRSRNSRSPRNIRIRRRRQEEHSEFSSNIDLIDVLPPGLYKATFEAKSADAANAELAGGKWIMRCEPRTLDDIRAMGGNAAEDERRFATAARVSEINLAQLPEFRAAMAPRRSSSPTGGVDTKMASASRFV